MTSLQPCQGNHFVFLKIRGRAHRYNCTEGFLSIPYRHPLHHTLMHLHLFSELCYVIFISQQLYSLTASPQWNISQHFFISRALQWQSLCRAHADVLLYTRASINGERRNAPVQSWHMAQRPSIQHHHSAAARRVVRPWGCGCLLMSCSVLLFPCLVPSSYA